MAGEWAVTANVPGKGPAFGRILKSAGYFSIHTPLDAHRPKIKAEGTDRVFKLVVKIPVRLFPAT